MKHLPTQNKTKISCNFFCFLLVPSLPPSNATARGINSSSIFVRWDPVPVEGRHGIITHYAVTYRKQVQPPAWKIESCDNMYWCQIKDLEMNTPYYIHVKGFTVKGPGPYVRLKADTEKGGKV